MTDWQPIETAPSEVGKPFLAYQIWPRIGCLIISRRESQPSHYLGDYVFEDDSDIYETRQFSHWTLLPSPPGAE